MQDSQVDVPFGWSTSKDLLRDGVASCNIRFNSDLACSSFQFLMALRSSVQCEGGSSHFSITALVYLVHICFDFSCSRSARVVRMKTPRPPILQGKAKTLRSKSVMVLPIIFSRK